MRIVHVAPSAPYNDYWGYQENLLPKYHSKLGNQVIIITTNTMHSDGQIIEIQCDDYTLDDGVRVIRLNRKKYFHHLLTGLASKLDIYDLLEEIQPDYIFFHGLVSSSIYDVIKFKRKHKKCIVVQDNHLDYNIGFPVVSFKDKIKRLFYRTRVKMTIPYVDKVFGVTPWRIQYAEDYFGVPREKLDLLIMGADDEQINFQNRDKMKNKIRKGVGIKEDDFLIVSGGKIDRNKNIDILMSACSKISNVKLIIFGNVADDIKQKFDDILSKSSNIHFAGWIPSNEVYDYFLAADLVFFPGQHSVLWEQACASKVPCVFKRWDGMEHVDNGGNSQFINLISEDEIERTIKELVFTEKYSAMKKAANSEITDIYLYSNIAKFSLESVLR